MLKELLWRSSPNKAVDVDVDKSGHEELAVEPIHDSTMARNDITEVLDFKSSFESTRKEPSKRSNHRGKNRHEESMQKKGIHGQRLLHVQLKKRENYMLLRIWREIVFF